MTVLSRLPSGVDGMSEASIIAVFAKPPVAGAVKTRLASTLGAAQAAELARAFLADTWAAIAAVDWAQPVLATTAGRPADFGLPDATEVWLQGEGDLGQRIDRVVRRGLAAAATVIAIGADTPGLPRRLLEGARAQLALRDAVLGPCDDGGFYLIGLRRCPPGLLEGLPWSSPQTFVATKQRLEAAGMQTTVLEPWFDVDRAADVERLRVAIERGDVSAPASEALLARTKHRAELGAEANG